MKIHFDAQEAQKITSAYKAFEKNATAVDKKKTATGVCFEQGMQEQTAFSGAEYFGIMEDGKGKPCLEGLPDVETRSRFMAVLSNTMSPEEFGKMTENGYDLSEMDPEEAVNILDRIKVELLRAGVEIEGYTDTVSEAAAKEILGNAAYAERLTSLSEPAMDYMVSNELEPTMENLYTAQYSSGAQRDYTLKEIPIEIKEQMREIIKEAGLPENEEVQAQAEHLFQAGLPLTKESLDLYNRLNKLEFPITKEVLTQAIKAAFSRGRGIDHANLSMTETVYEEALRIRQEFQEMPEEELALRADRENLPLITARRQLEEIRLMMTVEANMKLLQSDFEIDTAPMTDLVEKLKQQESQLRDSVVSQFEELKEVPAQILGPVVRKELPFTPEEMLERGKELRTEAINVEERYEKLWTAPRRDLGDSITKAFQNTDTLLEEMDFELTEENRRAVRILGYNSMEITKENMYEVKAADLQVQNVLRGMTGPVALKMIREGIDPLKLNITELEKVIGEYGTEFEKETEKFAKFLHRLDRKHELSAEEREACIGVFRIIRQLEKTDGAAIGHLLETGGEISLENLKSALRSRKKEGMDYRVDETFQGVDGKSTEIPVSDLISQINKSKVHEFWEKVSPEWIRMEEQTDEEEMQEAFLSLQKELKQAGGEKEVMNFLLRENQTVTINNILTAGGLLFGKQFLSKGLRDYEEKEDRTTRSQKLFEAMDDKESMQKEWENFSHETVKALEKAQESMDTLLDIRGLQSVHRQISLCTSLAKNEYFVVPIETEKGYADMHVRFLHGTDEGKIEIKAYVNEVWAIEAEITEGENGLTCHLEKDACPAQFVQALKAAMSRIGYDDERFFLEEGRNLKSGVRRPVQKENGISSKELYKIAKTFVETVRNTI